MKYIFLIITLITFLNAEDNKTIPSLIENLEKIVIKKDDNISVDSIVEAKNKIFDKVIFNLKTMDLKIITFDSKKANFLSQRIAINQERGNDIAVARDKLEILFNMINSDFYKLLIKLQEARDKFLSKKEIEKIVKTYISNLDSIDFTKESGVYQKHKGTTSVGVIVEFNQNYEKFISRKKIYREVADYLLLNLKEIEQKNLIISNLNIETLTNLLDDSYFAKEINIYLEHYFSLKFGKLVVAFTAMIFIMFFIKLIPILIFIIEKSLNESGTSSIKIHYFIRDSLNLPVKVFLFVFAIEVAIRIASTNVENIKNFVFMFHNFYLILVGIIVYNLINNAVIYFSEAIIGESSNVKKELINFFVKFLKVIVFIIIVLIILKEMGYNLTAIVASLGVGGIAIALAAKDTLTNLFGSLSIMLDDVFSQGDLIETEKVKGTVVELGIRSTTIRTFDNALVTVSNSYLAEASILNWSKRKIGRQIKFSIGVTYQSNLDDVRNAIEEIYKMLVEHPDIADDTSVIENIKSTKILSKEDAIGVKKNIKVILDDFAPYSINMLVYCFSKSVHWDDWLKVKEDVLYKIWKILKNNNLEFAYPTQTLFIEK